MHILDVLKERGFIAQVTFEDELYEQLKEPTTLYVGFDPTADSLHIGHYIPIMAMAHMQRAGHRPIALMGGGTGMIGDPSGKSDMRKMLTTEDIDHNVACIKKQMSRFLDLGEGGAIIANNADWLRDLNYIEFLREIGKYFSVNQMLTAECYKQRLERGLTFLEFNYMLMQGYDFLELFRRYGCRLEMGGDDQWSNMLAGADLIRRKEQERAFALTFKLLLTHEGKKMGKTEKGALWLDPEKTTPYEFYQYWRNVDDADVLKCIRMLTFLPLEQIDEMADWKGEKLNEAKELLAFELTKLVHSEAEAEKAREASRALFSGAGDVEHMPTTELTNDDLGGGQIDVLSLLVKCGLAASKGEARRLVQQGGVTVNDQKINSIDAAFGCEQFTGDGVVIRKGKKVFHRAVLV